MIVAVVFSVTGVPVPKSHFDDDDDDNNEHDEMLSALSQNYLNIVKFYLHDAVYLYLQTVNQTLAEGYSDYRDGRLIVNKTIGQRFVGQCSIRMTHF